MSWNPMLDVMPTHAAGLDSIDTLLVPRARDIGDFEVRRDTSGGIEHSDVMGRVRIPVDD